MTNKNQKLRFSIRKLTVGTVSVMFGALIFGISANQVKADETSSTHETEQLSTKANNIHQENPQDNQSSNAQKAVLQPNHIDANAENQTKQTQTAQDEVRQTQTSSAVEQAKNAAALAKTNGTNDTLYKDDNVDTTIALEATNKNNNQVATAYASDSHTIDGTQIIYNSNVAKDLNLVITIQNKGNIDRTIATTDSTYWYSFPGWDGTSAATLVVDPSRVNAEDGHITFGGNYKDSQLQIASYSLTNGLHTSTGYGKSETEAAQNITKIAGFDLSGMIKAGEKVTIKVPFKTGNVMITNPNDPNLEASFGIYGNNHFKLQVVDINSILVQKDPLVINAGQYSNVEDLENSISNKFSTETVGSKYNPAGLAVNANDVDLNQEGVYPIVVSLKNTQISKVVNLVIIKSQDVMVKKNGAISAESFLTPSSVRNLINNGYTVSFVGNAPSTVTAGSSQVALQINGNGLDRNTLSTKPVLNVLQKINLNFEKANADGTTTLVAAVSSYGKVGKNIFDQFKSNSEFKTLLGKYNFDISSLKNTAVVGGKDDQSLTISVADFATKTKTVTETIHYLKEDGSQIAPDYTATITFTGKQRRTDNGDVIWTWTSDSANDTFKEVASPVIQGFTANPASVAKQVVSKDSKNLNFTVTYTAVEKPDNNSNSDNVEPEPIPTVNPNNNSGNQTQTNTNNVAPQPEVVPNDNENSTSKTVRPLAQGKTIKPETKKNIRFAKNQFNGINSNVKNEKSTNQTIVRNTALVHKEILPQTGEKQSKIAILGLLSIAISLVGLAIERKKTN